MALVLCTSGIRISISSGDKTILGASSSRFWAEKDRHLSYIPKYEPLIALLSIFKHNNHTLFSRDGKMHRMGGGAKGQMTPPLSKYTDSKV